AVRELGKHPYGQAGLWIGQKLRKLESLLEVKRSLAKLASDTLNIESVPPVPREEFLRRYYSTNCPVVLTGALSKWPALAKWSPKYFRESYGTASVEVMANRAGDPEYEM